MKVKILGDRNLYEAETYAGIVEEIRHSHPYPEDSAEEFIAAYASRMSKWDGSRIDASSAENFVLSMLRAGQFCEA